MYLLFLIVGVCKNGGFARGELTMIKIKSTCSEYHADVVISLFFFAVQWVGVGKSRDAMITMF